MGDCKLHCEDHEGNLVCLVKLKGRVDNFEENWESGRKIMSRKAEQLETKLGQKLGASTFYKTLSAFIVIMTIALGVQWTLLFNIDAKVDKLVTNQAVIAHEMDIDLTKVGEVNLAR